MNSLITQIDYEEQEPQVLPLYSVHTSKELDLLHVCLLEQDQRIPNSLLTFVMELKPEIRVLMSHNGYLTSGDQLYI